MIKIRAARIPGEIGTLLKLDAQTFQEADVITSEDEWLYYWKGALCYFLSVGSTLAGSLVLCAHKGMWDEEKEILTDVPGCVHLVSIGILPEFQGRGLGSLLMTLGITHARVGGFSKVVSVIRPSNIASRKLHERFGFRKTGTTISGYFEEPDEPGVMYEKNFHA